MEPKDNDREYLADKLLDAGLQHYNAAEPRAGLEGRVLANLRAKGDRLGARTGLRSALAALAFVIVVGAITFIIRKRDAGTQIVATHAGPGFVIKQAIATAPTVKRGDVDRPSPPLPRRKRVSAPAVLAADDGPKLEQFPSPRPLSEQEEMLARYVRERPQEAQLVARAQAELLQRDLIEFERQNDSPETPDSMR